MGWCSGTSVFDPVWDAVRDHILAGERVAVLKQIIDAFEDADWDCAPDSKHFDTPEFQQAERELHPDWFTG